MESMTKVQGHYMWRDAPETTVSNEAVLPGARRWELWCLGRCVIMSGLAYLVDKDEFASEPS